MEVILKAKTRTSEPQTGIVSLKARHVTVPPKSTYHWKLLVDVSASMDECEGISSKSRIENVRSTLVNLIYYLAKQIEDCSNAPKHIMDIITFSGTNQTYSYTFNLGIKQEITEAICVANSLKTYDATDISSAIEAASNLPTTLNAHVCVAMLTDGEVTAGCGIPKVLKERFAEYLSEFECVSAAVIGYGAYHDSELLETLATVPCTEYHCVESSEGAGAVYGEIAHGFTYEAHRDVRLEIKGAFIHDGINDKWVKSINIGRMADQSQRTWYWKADGSGTKVKTKVTSKAFYPNETIIKERIVNNTCIVPDDNNVDEEVVIYDIRAQTQILLNKARIAKRTIRYPLPAFKLQRAPSFNPMKDDTQMKDDADYMTPQKNTRTKRRREESLEEQLEAWLVKLKDLTTQFKEDHILHSILCTLADDTYITLRSLRSTNGYNFIVARQTSQGIQRAYNPYDLNALDDENTLDVQHTPSHDSISPYASISAKAMMRTFTGDATQSST